jgi:hypothetical protein
LKNIVNIDTFFSSGPSSSSSSKKQSTVQVDQKAADSLGDETKPAAKQSKAQKPKVV